MVDVSFDPVYGGSMSVRQGFHTGTQESIYMTLRRNGTTIGSQTEYEILSVTGEAQWGTFEGWMQGTKLSDYSYSYVLSPQIYTTEQVYAMAAPAENTSFVAKWSGIDYAIYGELGYKLSGTKAVELALNTKYALGAESTTHFVFDAPETGTYTLYTDAPYSLNIGVLPNNYSSYYKDLYPATPMGFALQKDQHIEWEVSAWQAANFWVKKAASVTKLEVASQDTTKHYTNDASLQPVATMDAV